MVAAGPDFCPDVSGGLAAAGLSDVVVDGAAGRVAAGEFGSGLFPAVVAAGVVVGRAGGSRGRHRFGDPVDHHVARDHGGAERTANGFAGGGADLAIDAPQRDGGASAWRRAR